jgi:uncharacterized protein
MRCFFFGETGRQLYGALHSATAENPRNTCVVLAYPWLHEYNHCHAAFRRLAGMLERAGFATLRFDYSGTGDSHGAPSESFCRDWQQDIATACRELSVLSRARSLCIVGLGIGGALAAAAAEAARVDHLVLWEPVLSGEQYLDQLDQLDRRYRVARLYGNPAPRAERDQLLGFSFSQAARKEMARLDLRQLTVCPDTYVSLIAPTGWSGLTAVRAKFPMAHCELFTRQSSQLDMNDQSAMLSHEPLLAIVRAVERVELTS